MSDHKFTLPIYGIAKPKKGALTQSLNVNWYRNAYHRSSNDAKKKFKAHVKPQIEQFDPIEGKIKVKYVYYAKANNSPDLDNFVGTVKKFFQDAIVECGLITDDNVNYIVENKEVYGGIDKDNPRIEAFLTVVDDWQLNT